MFGWWRVWKGGIPGRSPEEAPWDLGSAHEDSRVEIFAPESRGDAEAQSALSEKYTMYESKIDIVFH